jgi:hypothetical protein
MMAAQHRRVIEGGSYKVTLSLAHSATWIRELGLIDVAAQGEVPETGSCPAETVSIDTAYGAVTLLAPPLTLTNPTPPTADRRPPYGSGQPKWLPRP